MSRPPTRRRLLACSALLAVPVVPIPVPSLPTSARCSAAAATPAPHLSGLTITPSVFADAYPGARDARTFRLGTTVSYTDSEAATTTFTVVRVEPGPPALPDMTIGSFTRSDAAGRNSFHFSGYVGGRLLPGGAYRLQARARRHGASGNTVGAAFSVLAVAV